MEKDDIIAALQLEPHPEGGWYRRTYTSAVDHHDRKTASAIYFLLEGGEFSLWHRTHADELWFWHAGSPLKLETAAEGEKPNCIIIGPDLLAGEAPQALAPGDRWQRSCSLGDWTLVSCAVTPEFRFEDYELVEDRIWMP